MDISLLIPILKFTNEQDFFESLSSLILKNLQVEVIFVVKDGSIKTIIEKHFTGMGFARIEIIVQEGENLSSALNEGLQKCRGKYTARIDEDDIQIPSRIQSQYLAMNSRKKLVALGCQSYSFSRTSKNVSFIAYPFGAKFVKSCLEYGSYIPHSAVMFKTDVLKFVGGYSTDFPRAEDWDLWLRIRNFGDLDNLKDFLILRRLHEEQVSVLDIDLQFKMESKIVTNIDLGVYDPRASFKLACLPRNKGSKKKFLKYLLIARQKQAKSDKKRNSSIVYFFCQTVLKPALIIELSKYSMFRLRFFIQAQRLKRGVK